MKIASILVNNADSDKVPHNEAFHLDLHRFPNNIKGLKNGFVGKLFVRTKIINCE